MKYTLSMPSLAFAAALALSAAAHAQNNETGALDEIVVTATRTGQALSDLVADVSIIDRETIDNSGASDVADVLARLPGIEFARNGGPGSATSVYIRGAETRYTAVFIDGARVDSQATGGAPWEALPLALVERIEIIRGPAAAVYGSDAIAGVIQIFTRKGSSGTHPWASVGAGNRSTRDVSAGISGASDAWDYSFSGAYTDSNGFNALTDPGAWGYNPDRDGHTQKSAQARAGLQINPRHRLDAALLGSRLNSGYDESAFTDDRNQHRLHTASLGWKAQWSERYSTLLSVNDSTARYESTPNPYLADTSVRSWLFQNEYRVGIHQFTAALERREDSLRNLDFGKGKHHQNAVAAGYGLNAGAHTVQANARYDDDSEFGSKATGSLAWGYEFIPHWRVSASAGTAFRAPTLYQRFSDYGSAGLEPETSRNVEAALRYAHQGHSLSATVYRNRVKNQISYVSGPGGCASSWGCFENTARARYEGVTLAGSTRLAGVFLNGSVDFQNPKDETTGKLLARRARRYATLGAQTTLAGWNLGAEMQASAKRWDDAANTSRLGGYALYNFWLSRDLGRDLTLHARLDNAFDKDYELARTYATAGRTVFLSLRWTPSY